MIQNLLPPPNRVERPPRRKPGVSSSPASSGTSHPLRLLLLGLLFAAGLFGTSLLIGVRLPFPRIAIVSEKVDWLEAHGEEYDTLFIGSSRVYHQIIPELFDQLMAEAGMKTRSYSLGVDAMRPPEDSVLLETVLAKRKKPLGLVIVESYPIVATVPIGLTHTTPTGSVPDDGIWEAYRFCTGLLSRRAFFSSLAPGVSTLVSR